MNIKCPGCKKSFSITTSQAMQRSSKVICPGCRQAISLQSSLKNDVDIALKQTISKLKLK